MAPQNTERLFGSVSVYVDSRMKYRSPCIKRKWTIEFILKGVV